MKIDIINPRASQGPTIYCKTPTAVGGHSVTWTTGYESIRTMSPTSILKFPPCYDKFNQSKARLQSRVLPNSVRASGKFSRIAQATVLNSTGELSKNLVSPVQNNTPLRRWHLLVCLLFNALSTEQKIVVCSQSMEIIQKLSKTVFGTKQVCSH